MFRKLRQLFQPQSSVSKSPLDLGKEALEQGKLADACAHLEHAIAIEPLSIEPYRHLCFAYFQVGKMDVAERLIEQGIKLRPDIADFHFCLGNLHHHANRLDAAITCYKTAISLDPNQSSIYYNLGLILQAQGKPAEAIACYETAISLDPSQSQMHYNLGFLLHTQGKPIEAIACYETAISLDPGQSPIYYNLGVILYAQGKTTEARDCFLKALGIDPTYAEALNGLGACLQKLGDKHAALSTFEKCLTVAPDQFRARLYLNIGILQRELGNVRAALTAFRIAFELEPQNQDIQINLFHDSLCLAEWGNLEITASTILKNSREPLHSLTGTSLPFAFLVLPNATSADQKAYAQRYIQSNFDGMTQLKEKLSFEQTHRLGKKIRIGYLSADFQSHPVSRLMARVFEKHDHNKFQFTAYSLLHSDGTALRQRVENAFDRFIDVAKLDSVSTAKKIHEDQIDILVDLMGHTGGARPEILALRPAPIQVNYLGYPGTMGAKFMDYIIADNFIIPPELEGGYTERVLRLPYSYQPRDDSNVRPPAPSRAMLGLPENGFVFCCFNQTIKITPKIFGIWCELLDAIPDSVLWLMTDNVGTQNNLRREAAKRGIDPCRLIDAPRIPFDDHIARIQCADLFLDTVPYNAHTTCSDALWMGLPVLTCSGETFASRVGGSLLTAMGVPELITYNLSDYKALALELATNKEKLHGLRSKVIANRNTSPHFDSTRFTRDLEALYSSMIGFYQKTTA